MNKINAQYKTCDFCFISNNNLKSSRNKKRNESIAVSD